MPAEHFSSDAEARYALANHQKPDVVLVCE